MSIKILNNLSKNVYNIFYFYVEEQTKICYNFVMQKVVLIDRKLKENYLSFIKNQGYDVVYIPENKRVYDEVSSHTDISCTKIKGKVIIEPRLNSYLKRNNLKGVICGNKNVCGKYPYDVLYNVCVIGNVAIHNFKFTDKAVLKYIKKNKLKCVNVKQGYTNCSIAKIGEKACITSNSQIARKLVSSGIDVLLIDTENEKNIKLLKNNGTYSNMHGFIGGCMTNIENKIILFGDYKKLIDGDKIKKFVESYGYEFVWFVGEDLIDYGGAVVVKRGR